MFRNIYVDSRKRVWGRLTTSHSHCEQHDKRLFTEHGYLSLPLSAGIRSPVRLAILVSSIGDVGSALEFGGSVPRTSLRAPQVIHRNAVLMVLQFNIRFLNYCSLNK